MWEPVQQVLPLEIQSSCLENGKSYLHILITADGLEHHCLVLQWRLGSKVGSHTNTKKKWEVMRVPKFMALHTLPKPGEVEATVPIARKVKAYSTLDAYWVGTWVQLNKEGKVLRFICEWNAKDAESIQKVFDKVPELPVDGIYPMAKLDSEDYR